MGPPSSRKFLGISGSVSDWRAPGALSPRRQGATMTLKAPARDAYVLLAPPQLDSLIQALLKRGYQVIGPTIRDSAIVYDQLSSLQDLPKGWTDEQEGGKYRLKRRPDEALFGYTVSAAFLETNLVPAIARLWKAQRTQTATSRYFGSNPIPVSSHFLAFAPVNSTPLRSRTRFFSKVPTPTLPTNRVARTSSSQPSIARRPAAHVSAIPWGRGRKRLPAMTWH